MNNHEKIPIYCELKFGDLSNEEMEQINPGFAKRFCDALYKNRKYLEKLTKDNWKKLEGG